MPTYEYKCRDCRKKFSIIQTVTQHDKRRVKCPRCSSRRVEQQVGSFFVVTSKKS